MADSFEELVKRAEAVIDRRSRGYVEDAIAMAKWILSDGKAMLDNFTATQTRCTELLEENRLLKTEAITENDLGPYMVKPEP